MARLPFALGLLLIGTGMGLAVFGLRRGNSIGAQFSAEIGFAVFTAGLIDFVVAYGINRFREASGRETRRALEKIDSLIADNRRAQENLSTAAQDLKRMAFEHQVLDDLTSLKDQVDAIRMSVDHQYEKKELAREIEKVLRPGKAPGEQEK